MSKSTDLKERTDIFIALVVTALFGAFILNAVFTTYSKNNESILGEALSTSLIAAKTTEEKTDGFFRNRRTSIEETNTSISTRQKIYSVAVIAPVKTQSIQSSKKIQLKKPVIETVQNELPELKNSISKSSTGSDDLSAVPDDVTMVDEAEDKFTADMESANEITVPKETSVPTNSKTISMATDQDECGIIVGSYGSRTNQLKMIDKLKTAGYDTFGYKEKGLFITAIRLPCDKDVMESTIKTIRSEYAKGAFIITK